MDQVASDTPSNSDEKNLRDLSADRAYNVLCDIRDAIARNPGSFLSAASFGDLAEIDLLTLAAMNIHRSAARALIRRLEITSQKASQSVEKLIMRGYLDVRDNPDQPRQATLIITERGHTVFAEFQDSLKAHE
jgi:DNA-binding MarR family transcriptional regulator